MLPRNTNEALNENWRDAMQQEYNSLVEKHLWELVPLPENVKAIGSNLHFANKYDSDGNVTKHKAPFVAKVIVNNKVLTTKTHTRQLLD